MLNYRVFFSGLFIASCLSGAGAASSLAEEAVPAPLPVATAAPPPAQPAESLAIMDIVIDKTDKNAVAARTLAITEAKRTAFRKLAEKSLPPEKFVSWQMPDDKVLAPLVQDFEIKNEQMSANRYAARFTVRFTPEALTLIQSGSGGVKADSPQPKLSQNILNSMAALTQEPRKVLVLPYFQDISGKIILWGKNNPWMETWQAFGSSIPAAGLTVMVPQGDAMDLSFGDPNSVWNGDYNVIEKLRTRYKSGEVLLAAANKSGQSINLEISAYKDGKLGPKKALNPYTSGEDEKNILRQTVAQVLNELQSPADETPHEMATPLNAAVAEQKPSEQAPEKLSLETMMSFSTFSQWLEAQKRLSTVSPPTVVEISSLSKNSARFTLTVTVAGGMNAFKSALQKNGLSLMASAGEAAAATAPAVGPQVYILTMTP